jgi:hypothetical protein
MLSRHRADMHHDCCMMICIHLLCTQETIIEETPNAHHNMESFHRALLDSNNNQYCHRTRSIYDADADQSMMMNADRSPLTYQN